MSDALTPQFALAYLGELQPSLSAAAIRDEGGRLVAGEAPGDGAPTLAARRGGYSIEAAPGPGGDLETLVRLDLDSVLAALTGEA